MDTATIGDRNPAGTYEVTDTAGEACGAMRVTVRELYGSRVLTSRDLAAMRRLARRALDGAATTHVIRTWYAGGCSHATFRVTR